MCSKTWTKQCSDTIKTTSEQEKCVFGNVPCPLLNSLGAKPKNKSVPRVMGGPMIEGAHRPEICNTTCWRYLPVGVSHQSMCTE